MIYFIADTHFSHSAIMGYENRPFGSVEEMNETIIANWNKVVLDEDVVYVLGDFGMPGAFSISEGSGAADVTIKCQQLSELVTALRGTKYLIKGNHDTHSNEFYRRVGFAEVYDKPIILENFWILSHEPLYVCENMPYANIFGHVHGSPLYRDFSKHHYCVSVERIDYTPVSFADVKKSVQEAVQ